ncbi:MAG: putative acetyltransferase [Symbiobacteriaceae bacterium]|jgi:RimJ/RimL family protein N-acetyltransferase|nr:putative acetyltransferase [Symbiobacteriaceae bacterium]
MDNDTKGKRSRKADPELDRVAGHLTILRRVVAADLPVLQAWDDDPEIIALMGRKYAETDVTDWFRSLNRDRTCRIWAIDTQEGQLIGEVELAHLNWRNGSTELRICIGDKNYWSHGYGTDALRAALGAAFDGMGLESVYLRVFITNTRAIRTYEKLGFRRQAILEPSARRQDPAAVLLMNLTRQRWHMKQAQSA